MWGWEEWKFMWGQPSRSNPFEERGDDADQPNTKRNHANDPLEVPIEED